MTTKQLIHELKCLGLDGAAHHVKAMEAEIAELRATSRLQGALIAVAAKQAA